MTSGFAEHDRGKLIMACGTGKTFTALRIAEAGYRFDETCQGTVPAAISCTCALESTSFEDAVRNAVSLGGDAETLGAITGPIAEVLHGIPGHLVATATERYPSGASDIHQVMKRMYDSP